MSELPITHCEHGIDRAYRCIDCIEAERDRLRAELASFRASIVALADEWDAIAKRQRDEAEWDSRLDRPNSATSKDGRAIGYEACARELRQLGEGNGRD